MRLLNTNNHKLENFEGDEIPLYAILSHRWGKDEITLQDMERGAADKKAGYEKTSSTELSEAINSMYRWYQGSGVCYAYLADVPSNTIDHQTGAIGPELSKSEWFTRGWTLQELIAPSMVMFLDQAWQGIGTKSKLRRVISEITGIPDTILQGADLESASVAQRMSWASNRKTTRVEDLAYCLMGIFNINMPMLYGEGERSFIRLQEEIMKVSDDHSIFAWESADNRGGLLATSPEAFSKSSKIIPLDSSSTLSGAITVNNKGIHLKLHLRNYKEVHYKTALHLRLPVEGYDGQYPEIAILPCKAEGQSKRKVAIYMDAISETKEYFRRAYSRVLEVIDLDDFSQSDHPEKNICVQRKHQTYNQTPLPKAAGYGNETVVKLLLDDGANPESRDGYGLTPLLRAAEKGHKAVVGLLLDKGANLGCQGAFCLTPLLYAARNGYKEVVELLLNKGADLESRCGGGQTSLSYAAEKGHKAVVELLLDKGANLEAKDNCSEKPLIWAIKGGHKAVVQLLFEKGADFDPESTDRFGLPWLSLAAGKGYKEIVELLLENGTDLESRASGGRTSLSYAAEKGHMAIVELMLDKGANLESGDSDGRTSLSYAAENGHEAVVKLLLDKGADLEPRGGYGQTPLSYAAEKGHEAVVKLLLDKGADVQSKDGACKTSLSHAVENGHEAVVELLLEKGAEFVFEDSFRLMLSSWMQNMDMK